MLEFLWNIKGRTRCLSLPGVALASSIVESVARRTCSAAEQMEVVQKVPGFYSRTYGCGWMKARIEIGMAIPPRCPCSEFPLPTGPARACSRA